MAKIALYSSDSTLREVALQKERTTIGRASDNDVVLNDISVSGRHAVILKIASGTAIEDLDSTNGTKVNGQPVRTHFLNDGDWIELGHYKLQYMLF